MERSLMLVLAIFALLGLVGLYATFMYNRMIRGWELTREAWSGIDVQLRRRTSLIPNLVQAVGGYATHDPPPVGGGGEGRDRRHVTVDHRPGDAGLDRPACAVVVGTSKPQKNWHAAGYARVLDELESRWKLRPVLVGGPSPVERRIADEVLVDNAIEEGILDRAEVNARTVLDPFAGSGTTAHAAPTSAPPTMHRPAPAPAGWPAPSC